MYLDINIVLGIVISIIGLTFTYLSYKRITYKDIAEKATDSGELVADLNYIKKGVDDIRIDIKAQERRVGELAERLTRVEESTKSAHHRLDELKEV